MMPLQDAADEALRRLGHDTRGSLNSLSLNIELLRQTLEDGGEGTSRATQRHIVDALQRELRALTALFNRLLEVNRK
jgi:signal transduction histidine kinase